MIKPVGYDDVTVQFGKKVQLPAGGYVLRIRQVQECESSKGAEQIKIQVDIAEGDYYNFWRARWEEKLEENRKAGYPKGGTVWISIYKGGVKDNGANPHFKAFCEAYKQSNNTDINWSASHWGEQFEGKFIGGVYGLREQEFKGYTYMQPEIRYWCSVDTIRNGEFTIPQDKKLNKPEEDFDGFAVAEEDIPF